MSGGTYCTARQFGSNLLCLGFICCWIGGSSNHALSQETTYEERDGVRYQVTRQVVKQQVPTTVMQDRQQTTYRQQVTTQTVDYNQLYYVPVTQYQTYYELRNRWNPFAMPYWEQVVEPVTTWQQQVAKVQLPQSQATWVPQTQTVQVPVTEFRMAEQEIVTRVAVSSPPSSTPNQALAATPTSATPQPPQTQYGSAYGQPAYGAAVSPASSAPTSIATRPSNLGSPIGGSPIGGRMLQADPPRQSSAWQSPPDNSRYR